VASCAARNHSNAPRDFLAHMPRIGVSPTIESQENKMYSSTLQLVGCPQCLAPAEITDRFVLDSTSGPVEHITVCCVNRHQFTMTAEHLPSASCRNESGLSTPASN
jgi:hypothetical protein